MFSHSNHEEKKRVSLPSQVDSISSHINNLKEEFQRNDFLKKLMLLVAGAVVIDTANGTHTAKLFLIVALLGYGFVKANLQEEKIAPDIKEPMPRTLFMRDKTFGDEMRKKYNIPKRVSTETLPQKTPKLLPHANEFQESAKSLRMKFS